jgi:RND family efflux transporter MFP subunit
MFSRSFALLVLLAAPLAAQEVTGLILPFKSVLISSPVLQEVIEKVAVEEGDTVKEGQLLVQLRNAKEQLTVQENEQIVKNAEFVAKGLASLLEQKMGSREAALKAATELALAKIRVELAKELLSEKTIKAPLSGVVVKKFKESGESVDRAEKIVEIVNIDSLYAQFYLEPKFIQILKLDQPISIRFPERKDLTVTGKISFIDERIDATSGRFRVKVLLPNPDRKIKAGMQALADFGKGT